MEDQHHPRDVVVVIVPLPAQGHLNQMLHLTRLITTRCIQVHYVGSATHNRQAKDRVHGWDPSSMSNLHFHDFQLPEFSTPPPDPHSSNKFPAHLVPTFKAYNYLREPLGVLLKALGSTNRRVVVVHDSLMAFAAHEASLVSNAEAYSFVSCSAFAVVQLIWYFVGKPADEEGKLIPKDVPRVSYENCFNEEFLEYLHQNSQWMEFCAGDLYNSCGVIEGRFIELAANLQPNKKSWAIGPFNPVTPDRTKGPHHKCLDWLDKQPPSSVIYVSFGTMTSISDDQVAELAIGLERSEQRFIWVLRDADRGDVYNGEVRKAQLPEGFEERVKGVGMVVRDWAPQLLVLAHSSTGGFMSHCGWNSTIESLSMGVPIAAWPMHSDQPSNSVLITEVLKVGLLVREWERREELVSAYTIESCIRNLMASERGEAMRKTAKELGEDVRGAVSAGGTSISELESFLSHLTR